MTIDGYWAGPGFMLHNVDRAENWREGYAWRLLLLQAERDYEHSEQAKGGLQLPPK